MILVDITATNEVDYGLLVHRGDDLEEAMKAYNKFSSSGTCRLYFAVRNIDISPSTIYRVRIWEDLEEGEEFTADESEYFKQGEGWRRNIDFQQYKHM